MTIFNDFDQIIPGQEVDTNNLCFDMLTQNTPLRPTPNESSSTNKNNIFIRDEADQVEPLETISDEALKASHSPLRHRDRNIFKFSRERLQQKSYQGSGSAKSGRKRRPIVTKSTTRY